ncbi:hypothetical protein PV797_20225 [Clostridiaceae bacterium M8S5]|nr:hypothetical protein PV797_20225 [Clostridiaceae bacterium M8S5]
MALKKVTALSLSAVMLFGILPTGALAATTNTQNTAIVQEANDNHRYMGNITYEEYMEQVHLKGNIPGADETKLKNIYGEIQKLRKNPYSEANHKAFLAKWDAFDKIIADHYVKPEPTFIELDEILSASKIIETITEKDHKALQVIYNKICEFDKAGKKAESEAKWTEFFTIYDKYIPEVFPEGNV